MDSDTVDAVVIGAGGPTGRKCVEKLLELKKTVRAVVRSPEKYKDAFPSSERLFIVKGDVTDAASLDAALKGAKGAIFAASGQTYFSANSVDKEGVGKTAAAAKKNKTHVVLITSAHVTPKKRFYFVRVLLNNIRWGLMDAKFAGENLLRESGASFTVVRPGGLTNDPPGKAKLVATQGDPPSVGRVSRADVAAVCVEALTNPGARNVTFELKSDPKAAVPPDNVISVFTDLRQGVYE